MNISKTCIGSFKLIQEGIDPCTRQQAKIIFQRVSLSLQFECNLWYLICIRPQILLHSFNFSICLKALAPLLDSYRLCIRVLCFWAHWHILLTCRYLWTYFLYLYSWTFYLDVPNGSGLAFDNWASSDEKKNLNYDINTIGWWNVPHFSWCNFEEREFIQKMFRDNWDNSFPLHQKIFYVIITIQ